MVLCGVLVALAAIFSYVEAIVPIPIGIPGVKLGFANIVTVFALYRMGFGSAFVICLMRILVVSALFANPTMAIYSLAGGIISLLVMQLFKSMKIFSIIGVSMAGGVFHNVAQVTVAVLVMETVGLYSYLAPLIIVGMITGIFIGVVSDKALVHLKRIKIS